MSLFATKPVDVVLEQTGGPDGESRSGLKLQTRDAFEHIEALLVERDAGVRFEAVGRVILACQQSGILKVGFLTEPRNEAQ